MDNINSMNNKDRKGEPERQRDRKKKEPVGKKGKRNTKNIRKRIRISTSQL